jgi:hypothetical protein
LVWYFSWNWTGPGFSAGKNKNVDMLKKQAKLTKKIDIFTTSF